MHPLQSVFQIPEMVTANENGLRKVKSSQVTVSRINIVGALKNAKIPESNLSPLEYKVIQNLQKDNSIMILPADNGRSTVILNKTEYEKKIESMLADDTTYKKLSRDPAP